MEPIRVLFDGYWWSAGPPSNRSVQRELVLAWLREFPEDRVAVAVRPDAMELAARELPAAELVGTRLWPHGVSIILELPRLRRSTGADVVITHNFSPLGGVSAVFIHDGMFVDHPEWFTVGERAYFSLMLPSARRAALVATSSRAEAARLERLAPRLAPVVPIGLAVSSALAGVAPVRPESVPEGRFALTVGRLNVRKNLAAAIRGAAASSSITPESPLLVVGSAEYSGRSGDLPAELRRQVDEGSVRFLGGIGDAELSWLYRNARLFLSLSLDEGFGLTPLEAATFGAPLLLSDIPAHRETVGALARLVDPGADAEVLGAAIDEAWDHGRPSESSGPVPSDFSWAASVHRLRSAVVDRLAARPRA